MTQTNLLWSGIEYYSLENCLVTFKPGDITVESAIVGLYAGKLYRVEYVIDLDAAWHTRSCVIKAWLGFEVKEITLTKSGEGWLLNGELQPGFEACLDIDIPLTPLTNTLPVNRLKLNVGKEQDINVIYIDLLGSSIRPVKQKYKRLDGNIYHYENIPNDFEADIVVDELGFVVDYPQLFLRKAVVS